MGFQEVEFRESRKRSIHVSPPGTLHLRTWCGYVRLDPRIPLGPQPLMPKMAVWLHASCAPTETSVLRLPGTPTVPSPGVRKPGDRPLIVPVHPCLERLR